MDCFSFISQSFRNQKLYESGRRVFAFRLFLSEILPSIHGSPYDCTCYINPWHCESPHPHLHSCHRSNGYQAGTSSEKSSTTLPGPTFFPPLCCGYPTPSSWLSCGPVSRTTPWGLPQRRAGALLLPIILDPESILLYNCFIILICMYKLSHLYEPAVNPSRRCGGRGL